MVYLAVYDLLFCIVHMMDHLYWVAQLSLAKENFCTAIAFLVQVCICKHTNLHGLSSELLTSRLKHVG